MYLKTVRRLADCLAGVFDIPQLMHGVAEKIVATQHAQEAPRNCVSRNSRTLLSRRLIGTERSGSTSAASILRPATTA
jgi:hypothetical protein